ncbi:MAG: 4'-phosphopantetheinyl transferase superfamily protein [Mobilicoccus sp.]|nr:4'-phosphopantetheinyl transferase superfamily protein [Mobilicoccus sp.]
MSEELSDCDVQVYWTRPVDHADLVHLLDPTEQEAFETLHRDSDRNRYATAHALLRVVLARHTGVPEDEQRFHRRCVICGGPHGKPRLLPAGADLDHAGDIDTPQVNLSYSGGRVMLALSETHPVGVDVEAWAATDFPGFHTAALTPAEARELLEFDIAERAAARTVWWARKEAILKATGHGLRVDATSMRVSAPDHPPRLIDWNDAEVPRPEVCLGDVDVPGDYAAAVAVACQGEVHAQVHEIADVRTHLRDC